MTICKNIYFFEMNIVACTAIMLIKVRIKKPNSHIGFLV